MKITPEQIVEVSNRHISASRRTSPTRGYPESDRAKFVTGSELIIERG